MPSAMADSSKKKIAIATVCSLLLVAMVVALLVVNVNNEPKQEAEDVSSSQKAISNLCDNTDYREACYETLKNTNSSDPKELIELAFQAAISQINEAAENSTVLAELEKDPRGKAAIKSCKELALRATNDLKRSFDKFKTFDVQEVDTALADLKIWLSGAITYQETCLDGFEGIEGDTGLQMRQFLNNSMQLTSNGLAMVTGISSVIQSVIGSQNFHSRRLLTEEAPIIGHDVDEMPSWIDFQKRKLLKVSKQKIKPDLVVAKDGSGNFTTINEALPFIPLNGNKTFTLYIKEGVYQEQVIISSAMTYLMIVGDGPTKTKITGSLNFIDGTNTYRTATVAVQADHFMARDIGFENSAGAEKHQAVALRVSGDMAIFYNCQMDGYQDTLYAHTYRQFYRDCVISGTIDFIFGDSAAVFQGCTLVVRKPLNNQQCIVTAQGRKDIRQPTGLVMQNCSFVSDPEYYPLRFKNKAYLGRPWKEYSRTIIMESFIDDLIQPEGWLPWSGDFGLETLFYTEFNNRGPGASKEHRVQWPGIKELPKKRIKRFTANRFLEGNKWIDNDVVPYTGKLIFKAPKSKKDAHYSPVTSAERQDLGSSRDKSAYITPKTVAAQSPSLSIPESQIALAPWMDPFAPAPENDSAAPAQSPGAEPEDEEEEEGRILTSIQKFFYRKW